jgi:hypothetical protein
VVVQNTGFDRARKAKKIHIGRVNRKRWEVEPEDLSGNLVVQRAAARYLDIL